MNFTVISTLASIAPGAIVVEWNVKQPSGQSGGAGMWDTHVLLGGGTKHNVYPGQFLSREL